MANLEQLKLNRRPVVGMRLVDIDMDFKQPGLSSSSPRLSSDDMLMALIVDPSEFKPWWSLELLPRLGSDKSPTN